MRFDDPEDPRTVFYLGDVYRALGEYELSLAWYRKRVAMTDTDDDPYRWWAMFQVAVLLAHLGAPASEVIAAHHACWSYRPSKLESLHELVLASIDIGDVDAALALTEVAFLLDRALFDHRIPLLRAALHLRVGDPTLGRHLALDLAQQPGLPESVRAEAGRLVEEVDADPVASGRLAVVDHGSGAGAPPTRLVYGSADRLDGRHTSMAAAWTAVGMEVTRARSLDAAALRWDPTNLGVKSARWTPGEVARLDAHRAAVEHAAQVGWETVIVADDLVAPGPRFAAAMAAIWRTLPDDWSLVHLAPIPPGSDRRLPHGQVYRVEGPVSAAAYAIHQRLYPLVLDVLGGARVPLDDAFELLSSLVAVYAVEAPIARGAPLPRVPSFDA
jgi:tetratricopeptide (TPR) repeat protein